MSISLRKVEQQDFELVQEMVRLPALSEYWRRYGDPFAWLSRDTFLQTFALTYIVSDDLGVAGLVNLCNIDLQSKKAEFGAMIIPHVARKGGVIATEALKQLFSYAFEYLGLNKLYAYVLPHREDIKHLFSKNGVQLEAKLKDNVFFNGKFHDEYYFSMTASQFQEFHGLRK